MYSSSLFPSSSFVVVTIAVVVVVGIDVGVVEWMSCCCLVKDSKVLVIFEPVVVVAVKVVGVFAPETILILSVSTVFRLNGLNGTDTTGVDNTTEVVAVAGTPVLPSIRGLFFVSATADADAAAFSLRSCAALDSSFFCIVG